MEIIKQFFEFELIRLSKYTLTLGNIINVLLTIIITLFVLWTLKKIINRKVFRGKHDSGTLYSLFQIIKYLIWIISIFMILDAFGIKINALLAGSAALLVGVGLGLQNTFNNFISGIILLFEGSIKVTDVLEIDGDVVQMQRIGLRTSAAINRDDIVILIPNSLITSNKVINWSHQTKKTRFKINVGVAYGSDVDLVMKLLKESALDHSEIKDKKTVSARFIDFGNSSLDFELLFFSRNIFRIEYLKSEIRININRKFRENNVTIPFPQMDVHFKSDDKGIFKNH